MNLTVGDVVTRELWADVPVGGVKPVLLEGDPVAVAPITNGIFGPVVKDYGQFAAVVNNGVSPRKVTLVAITVGTDTLQIMSATPQYSALNEPVTVS